MMATIRFLRMNRYGKAIGHQDSSLPYGVQDALVMRGVAEWVPTPLAAAISEPVLSDDQSDRRQRRHSKREN